MKDKKEDRKRERERERERDFKYCKISQMVVSCFVHLID